MNEDAILYSSRGTAQQMLSPTISQKVITVGGYIMKDPKYYVTVNDEIVITKNHQSELPCSSI